MTSIETALLKARKEWNEYLETILLTGKMPTDERFVSLVLCAGRHYGLNQRDDTFSVFTPCRLESRLWAIGLIEDEPAMQPINSFNGAMLDRDMLVDYIKAYLNTQGRAA